jgi:hypothetical protein
LIHKRSSLVPGATGCQLDYMLVLEGA